MPDKESANRKARRISRAASTYLGKLCACSRPAVIKRNGQFICAICRDIESRFRDQP